MEQKTNFPERATRLSHFFENIALAQNFPLLKSTIIPFGHISNLTNAVKLFFVDTLQSYYGRDFDSNADILMKYRNELLALPNITPNGLFLPKDRTLVSFNAVHQATVDIVESLGCGRHIDKVQLPIGLRLVKSDVDQAVASRPYATTKTHLDIWVGEPTYAFMAFIPLLGEVEKNGVGFHEPRHIPPELLKPLDDYLGGQSLIKDASTYPASFRKGELIVVDPFLLHNTLRQVPELRLSLEFRILPKEKVSSDIPNSGTTHANYTPYDTWKSVGRKKFFVTRLPLGVAGKNAEPVPAGTAAYELLEVFPR